MKTSPDTFDPRRLRKARADRSVEDLASAAGVSGQTVRNWESGASEPPASALAAIARLTGKSLDYFFRAA